MPQAIPVAISVGLFILARLLTPRPPGQKPQGEVSVSTSKIGQIIPFVIGTVKLSPNIVYYGKFNNKHIKKSGGFLKPSTDQGFRYYLDVMELICTGPIDSIEAIYQDKDKTNFIAHDFSDGDPLDTTVNINTEDSRVILFCGAENQVPNSNITSRLFVESGYPFISFALYIQGAMGQSPNWPNLSYIVKRIPKVTICNDYDPIVIDDDGNSGVNPAYAILDILTHPFLGNTISKSRIDENALWNIAQTLKNEKIFVNFAINQSTNREQLLNQLFLDIGLLHYERPDGIITFRLFRDIINYRILRNDTSSLLLETPTIETDVLANQSNSHSFNWNDKKLNYDPNQIIELDIASIKSFNQQVPEDREFSFFTDQSVVEKAIKLSKSITGLTVPITEFNLTYNDIYLEPGYKVKVDDKYWRVIRLEEEDNKVKVGVIKDTYRLSHLDIATTISYNTTIPIVEPIRGLESSSWPSYPSTFEPEAIIFEVPWEANNFSDVINIVVPAIKPNDSIVQGDYYALRTTETTNTYIFKVNSQLFTQGLIVVDNDGTTIKLNKLHEFQDPITESEVTTTQWQNNKILALVNQELVSIRKFDVTIGANYAIDYSYLLRGRLGTEEATSIPIGSIFHFGDPTIIAQDSQITLGEIKVKIAPGTNTQVLDLGYTDPINYTIIGVASGPLPIENLNGERTGDDVLFTWNVYYKTAIGKVQTNDPAGEHGINVEYSFDAIDWSTVPSGIDIIITNPSPITIYIRTNDGIRTSIKRFKTIT